MQNNVANSANPAVSPEVVPAKSEFRRVMRVFFGRKLVVVGGVLIVFLIITAIFAPWLAPYPPNDINMAQTLAKPSAEHWLGTDNLGRDVLSRILYGFLARGRGEKRNLGSRCRHAIRPRPNDVRPGAQC